MTSAGRRAGPWWRAAHRFPFSLYTEASLDLAADAPLMDSMVRAGFNMVFVGIETPDPATLTAIGKRQNCRADLLANVRAIQAKGLEVSGGFIMGFDGDQADIFDRQIRFIHEAAIPTAMVGLLTALPRTKLHARLAAEGRLLALSPGGSNIQDLDLNFVPRMDPETLRAGYQRVLSDVYRPSHYFARCLGLIQRMKHCRLASRRIRLPELRACLLSLVRQTCSPYAAAYWAFLVRALWLRPRMAAEIVTMAVKGHHFFTLTRSVLELERFKEWLEQSRRDLEDQLKRALQGQSGGLAAWKAHRDSLVARARTGCNRLNPDFRQGALRAFEAFQAAAERLGASRQGP